MVRTSSAPMPSQRLAIEPQSLGVGNRILQFQTEKPHEREATAKLVFRLIVGEIVERQP